MSTEDSTARNAGRTARERVRTELTRQIKETARAQLASAGASGLSLRAVARELGMVSSALYRYFPNRDELLTALLVDGYDALGAEAETAAAAEDRGDFRGRWAAACRGGRNWALRCPHEYALIHGSPVPGYRAPRDTVGPAARLPLVLLGVLRDARAAGMLALPAGEPPPSAALDRQLARTAAEVDSALPHPVLARALVAWSQLFGMLSFELFGQFAGSVDPADEFFEYAVDRMADFVGLPHYRRAAGGG